MFQYSKPGSFCLAYALLWPKQSWQQSHMGEKMRKIMLCLGVFTLLSFSAHAQIYDDIGQLEYRVRNLEQIVRSMDMRLRAIENGMTNPYPPQPPHPGPATRYTCLLVDTGYAKTFYSKSSSRLQAETGARQECGKSVHSSYCQGAVRCSNGITDPYSRGYFCSLADSGYSKTFSGEGEDPIEAEAKAKQSCQSSVHSSYCGNVTARCEAI